MRETMDWGLRNFFKLLDAKMSLLYDLPANYVAESIFSMLTDSLLLGFGIIFIVTWILCHIHDAFVLDHYLLDVDPISEIDLGIKYADYANMIPLVGGAYLLYKERGYDDWDVYDIDSHRMFPTHFSKRSESLLDIFFLVFPTVVVILFLVPALSFLYNNKYEGPLDTFLSIDIIGNQWYWSYAYNLEDPYYDFTIDSILDVDSLINATFHVDRTLVIPTDIPVTITVTSNDVIHSWGVPQLGIKIDAVPGRITRAILISNVDGEFYGQCYELCGVLHGFMPICVESVSLLNFYIFLTLSCDDFITLVEL